MASKDIPPEASGPGPMALSQSELERARDLGAATYASAYVRLMSIHLGIANASQEAINEMALQMVEGINFGTQAAWCGLMGDQDGINNALEQLRESAKALTPKHQE
jgi:hypothetical protein